GGAAAGQASAACGVRARSASLRRPLLRRELAVLEPGEFGEERQLDGVHWPVPLLGDDDLGDALLVAILDVDFLAIDEGDDVRVLLDRTRLAQVGEARLRRIAALDLTVQLRERDHRHVQLLGERLQRARYLRDILL